MNRFQKFIQASVKAGFSLAKKIPFLGRSKTLNRYESAFQGWGERSWIFQTSQDAWLEIDAMTRMELQRVHEWLIENHPVVQKIRNLKLQFSVGPAGLKIIADSSDETFNEVRSKNWEEWWAAPELGDTISGGQLTRVWAGTLFDKGEVFVYKTNDKIQNGLRTRIEPRLQTIDAHRVKSPPGMNNDRESGFPIIDGVVINPANGARVAYYVKRANYSEFISGNQGQTTEQFDRLDAKNVIHKFKRLRPGQVRGIPSGFSAFNLCRDNMDLHKLEMQAAKLASEIATVETNPAGELSTFTTRKQRLNIQTQNSAGASVNKNSWVNYDVALGAKRIALPTGTKLADFMINRPSVATQDYWDLHYTLICMGYNVPKLLVMPYSLQGTVTRADLDVCANAFREDFELIREICEEVYEYHGQWTLDRDTTFKAEPPDDAHACLIRPPRAPNVDIGYTAKALEIELRLGIKTPQDVFADKGQDWRIQVTQIAEFLDYVGKQAAKFNLQPGQLTSLAVQQAIEDPTSRPDPANDGKESSPENKDNPHVFA